MLDGFVRVAAAAPRIRVADPDHNAAEALGLAEKAAALGARFLCLPELCLTGRTCGDLFLQDTLVEAASRALRQLVADASPLGLLVAVGLPLAVQGKLYDVAAVFGGGHVYGFVPKTHMQGLGEFNDLRHFTPCGRHACAPLGERAGSARWGSLDVPFSTGIIFEDEDCPGFTLAVELCEDLWAPSQPSAEYAAAGATVIANLSACGEAVGMPERRRALVSVQSSRLAAGYVLAGAGYGESTQDMAFSGHCLIYENGALLCEARPFGDGWAASEIDLRSLAHERKLIGKPVRPNCAGTWGQGHLRVPFRLPGGSGAAHGGGTGAAHGDGTGAALIRRIDPHPFVPADGAELAARCEQILSMQAQGLAKRLEHTGSRHAAINVSGGLDSCLALLAITRAYGLLGWPNSDIVAATMPCFGTTSRTKASAMRLCAALGVFCREICISDTVRSHLADISHPAEARDVVYENAQARVRTLALMDIANQCGGIAIGTGDLTELALGWTTYNADHMSMYGVNAGVPKTLVRHIVLHVARTCGDAALAAALDDILKTPASPELLPPNGDSISQITESIVGPYELHDFFLYHTLRWGRAPRHTYALAVEAFARGGGAAEGGGAARGGRDTTGGAADQIAGAACYSEAEILRWLRVFYERFFAQQFKRSCMPDGPKVGSVTLSPRGGWSMPSDASRAAWARELDGLGGGE